MTHAGETEVRVEDAPDLRVEDAAVGELRLRDGTARWDAAGAALDSAGLAVRFTAGPGAPRPRQACTAAWTTSHRATIAVAAVVIACGLVASGLLARRNRRRSKSPRTP
jgi:hypothetical protein